MKSTHTHQTILSAIYIHAFVRESAFSLDFVFVEETTTRVLGKIPLTVRVRREKKEHTSREMPYTIAGIKDKTKEKRHRGMS